MTLTFRIPFGFVGDVIAGDDAERAEHLLLQQIVTVSTDPLGLRMPSHHHHPLHFDDAAKGHWCDLCSARIDIGACDFLSFMIVIFICFSKRTIILLQACFELIRYDNQIVVHCVHSGFRCTDCDFDLCLTCFLKKNAKMRAENQLRGDKGTKEIEEVSSLQFILVSHEFIFHELFD